MVGFFREMSTNAVEKQFTKSKDKMVEDENVRNDDLVNDISMVTPISENKTTFSYTLTLLPMIQNPLTNASYLDSSPLLMSPEKLSFKKKVIEQFSIREKKRRKKKNDERKK